MRPWMLAVWLGLVAVGTAEAHTLEVATARVTLRDGQVAVTAQIDVLALMQAATPEGAPLGLVAVADPTTFDGLAETVWATLKQGTILTVDGRPVTIVGWRFPAVTALRAEAQRQWVAQAVDDHVHATFSTITFEAVMNRPPAMVELGLPRGVGPVLVSVVQPVSQLVPAGRSVRIEVPPQSLSFAPGAVSRGPAAAP